MIKWISLPKNKGVFVDYNLNELKKQKQRKI